MSKSSVFMTPGESLPDLVNRIRVADHVEYPAALREARRQMTRRHIETARTVEDMRPILLYLLELIGDR